MNDKHKCEICHRVLSGYAIKILDDGHKICRKGICRKIYEKWHDIQNARATFQNMLRTGEIKKVYYDGYGGEKYKRVKKHG